MTRKQPYDGAFFERLATNEDSARTILPAVFELVHPATVVDVGGGTGIWAAVARELGADAIVVDGDYVDRRQLCVPPDAFIAHDLATPLDLGRRFDLAISLEVAEHLPPDRGPAFVRDLCAFAPAVLFSAAVPGQGGLHHINERWQSYWVGQFEAQGFEAFDVVRPLVWDHAGVKKWYRQNTFIAGAGSLADALRKITPRTQWDVVHPLYLREVRSALDNPYVSPLLRKLPGAVGRELRRRLRIRT